MFEEDNRSEEEIQADKRLNEQCFLLANLDVFEPWGQGTQYPNLRKMNGSNPKKFLGKLVRRPDLEDISRLKPSEIAELVPYIKIYKVYYETEMSDGEEYELKFENYLNNFQLEWVHFFLF